MSIDVARASLSVDPRGLTELKRDARVDQNSPETIRAVARQFESLFSQMLIKSMRATSVGDGLMDSEQSDFYQDIFDQQLSVKMTEGRGLGLADMLVRQLSGTQGAAAASVPIAHTADFQPQGRDDFVRRLWPHAQAAGRVLGVDPATIVSHAALETGWGKSLPRQADGQTSFNLFGIKATASWRGAAAHSSTLEYSNGEAARRVEPFRAYGSIGAAVADYARLLAGSPRYSAALNTGADVGAFATALQRAGYATDPGYAHKLQSVAAQVRALLGAGDPLKLADTAPLNPLTRSAT